MSGTRFRPSASKFFSRSAVLCQRSATQRPAEASERRELHRLVAVDLDEGERIEDRDQLGELTNVGG